MPHADLLRGGPADSSPRSSRAAHERLHLGGIFSLRVAGGPSPPEKSATPTAPMLLSAPVICFDTFGISLWYLT